jgi:hypothetical protein
MYGKLTNLFGRRSADPDIPVRLCRAVRDLSPPGELLQQASLPFEFKNVEMEYDSYRGQQVRLRCVRGCPDNPISKRSPLHRHQWLLSTSDGQKNAAVVKFGHCVACVGLGKWTR